MKTLSMVVVMLMTTVLLAAGCGQRTEEPKKATEAPVSPAPGAPAAPGAPSATVPGTPGSGAMTAPETKTATGPQTVKGDLVKVEGEFYVVKDASGKEVRLHVDKTSKVEGAPKAGDKVEAQMNPDGHATSLKKQ